MASKIIAGAVIGALTIAGGSFYAGVKYAGQSRAGRSGNFTQGFQGAPGGRSAGSGGGFIAGTIIAKDEASITIALGGPNTTSTNGTASGSKIVLYNASTQVGKFTTGAHSDLTVGAVVTIQGSQNTDGSITAQMIQIRPPGMSPRGQ